MKWLGSWVTLNLKLSELYSPLDFDLDLRKYRFLHLLAIHRKPNTVASSRWQARVHVLPGVLHESRPGHIFDEILKWLYRKCNLGGHTFHAMESVWDIHLRRGHLHFGQCNTWIDFWNFWFEFLVWNFFINSYLKNYWLKSCWWQNDVGPTLFVILWC